ncbi:MAG: OmpH family outer membrane protein [Spirochaetaceae bacterium]|jgi:outer membrane protein|nr:OmpH family outer membrane protein [Spirochaetaceae bacterium]
MQKRMSIAISRIVLLLLMLLPVYALEAQQITRFAVVDMSKVYAAVQGDARAARELEERTARVQQEIDKRTSEIQNLKNRYAEAALNENDSEAKKLEAEIMRKTTALKSYFDTENTKLEEQKTRLAEGKDFLNKVYNSLRLVAESEGYSMVLNLRESKSIAWYSQAIDITDKVIAQLRSSSSR